MKNKAICAVLACASCLAVLFAQANKPQATKPPADDNRGALVCQEWVARYDGPDGRHDTATAIAVDAAGSIYVTGGSRGIGSQADYATVKYDPQGKEVWVARYDFGNGSDGAQALVIDTEGNVYVTGVSDFRYATIKYDTDGNQLWVARYDGGYNPSAIAVDPEGNVYVTGAGWAVTTSYDYATVKYDPDGNELWVARYDGAVAYDQARGLALDPEGNVYVAGESCRGVGFPRCLEFATLKYDTDGNQLWVARYGRGGIFGSRANALGVDAGGNVYVTGESSAGLGDPDYATLKYDRDGNQLWVALYNSPSDATDRAVALALDAEGNVHVAGESTGLGAGHFTTIKYDADGSQIWVAHSGAVLRATGIALDGEGNVYVTGWASGYGYVTVKHDADGNEVWAARYRGPGMADRAQGIALDASGNVYVTGWSEDESRLFDYATIKYVQEPPASRPTNSRPR